MEAEDPRNAAAENEQDIPVTQEELLIEAARRGNEDLLAKLMDEKQVNINYIDGIGNTALHYAAGGGHLTVLVSLLDNGATDVVSWQNFQGETPLIRAVMADSVPCAQALIAAGACAKDRTVEGKWALDFVVSADMGHIIKQESGPGKLGDNFEGLIATDSGDDDED